MAKIINPLGSEAAHGHIGNSIIFQGTTAKAFRKPRNPNTPAQAAQRDLFRDITRTLRTCGAWARGAFRSQLGGNWWGALLPIVAGRWNTSSGEWAAFSSPNKEAWRVAAPYLDTAADAGQVFYTAARAIDLHFQYGQLFDFGMVAPIATNSAAVAAWYGKDLTGALMPGSYDDDHAGFVYSGPNHWLTDDWMGTPELTNFGGKMSWTISAVGEPSVEFYFVGNQAVIYYMGEMGQGTMKIKVDNYADVTISQSVIPSGYFNHSTPVLSQGLHYVKISQVGVTFPIYFDGAIVAGA